MIIQIYVIGKSCHDKSKQGYFHPLYCFFPKIFYDSSLLHWPSFYNLLRTYKFVPFICSIRIRMYNKKGVYLALGGGVSLGGVLPDTLPDKRGAELAYFGSQAQASRPGQS